MHKSISGIVLTAAATASMGFAAPDPVEDGIQATIDRIEEAVLEGDADAYLENIKPLYREFKFEQSEWARDMALKIPVEFDWEIDDIDAYDYGVLVDLDIRWQMEGERRRRIESWPAIFVPTTDGWKYAGRAWQTISGPGYIVDYVPSQRNRAERMAELMPEVIVHVHEELEEPRQGDLVQRIKVFEDMQDLQFSIYASYKDGLAGWNEPDESVKLLGPALRGNQGAAILAHEYGHAVNFSMGPESRRTPWWVLEGVAEMCASEYGGYTRFARRVVRQWKDQDELGPWDELDSFEEIKQEYYGHVYVQGTHMLMYITDVYGQTTRNEWVRAMAKGSSLNEACEDVLGLSFDELNENWLESIDVEP